MFAFGNSDFRKLLPPSLVVLTAIALCSAQSNRSIVLATDGAWQLHSHIPLGTDALLLQPAHRVIEMLASAEAPAFAGWTLAVQDKAPVLLDSSGHPVRVLPSSMTFRVTASARESRFDLDPMPVDSDKSLDEFLLDMHFTVQVFRGMEMRTVSPTRQWLIGIPADETSDERIYRISFELGDVRPDDRIVLLVTDGTGKRLSKFHLEFL